MNINDRIKEIVTNDYKSQSALAKDLDVSRVTIGSYVNEESKPNTEILQKFYNIGYNINWLISGNGSKRRYLLNNEQLDKFDKLVFFLDDKTYKSSSITHGEITKGVIRSDVESTKNDILENDNDLDEQISNDIRTYYYLRNSFIVLDRKLYQSNYTKYIKSCLSDPSEAISFDMNISAKLEELVSNNLELKDHNPINLKIIKNTDLNLLSNNLAAFLFLMTELNYYKESISQHQNDESLSSFLLFYHLSSSKENLVKPLNIIKISFKELKNRFIHVYNIFENTSYIDSKSKFFVGLIDKIFKIEQMKE